MLLIYLVFRIEKDKKGLTGMFKQPCSVCEPLLDKCGVRMKYW